METLSVIAIKALQGGGGSSPSSMKVGTVTSASTAFPTARPGGTELHDEDYVTASGTTFPFTLSGVTFSKAGERAYYDLATNQWALSSGQIVSTTEVMPKIPATESLSGTASTQSAINIENRTALLNRIENATALPTPSESDDGRVFLCSDNFWQYDHALGQYRCKSFAIVDVSALPSDPASDRSIYRMVNADTGAYDLWHYKTNTREWYRINTIPSDAVWTVGTLPTASAKYGIVFCRSDNRFYECVSDGATSPAYSWQKIETAPNNVLFIASSKPAADESQLGRCYFITSENLYFKCVSDGAEPPEYSWEQADLTDYHKTIETYQTLPLACDGRRNGIIYVISEDKHYKAVSDGQDPETWSWEPCGEPEPIQVGTITSESAAFPTERPNHDALVIGDYVVADGMEFPFTLAGVTFTLSGQRAQFTGGDSWELISATDDYTQLRNQPSIDGTVLEPNQLRSDIGQGLVGQADIMTKSQFVQPKAKGIDIVLDDSTPETPADIIDDNAVARYSQYKTSSNSVINAKFDEIDRQLQATISTVRVNELPPLGSGTANTIYMIPTSDPDIYHRWQCLTDLSYLDLGTTRMQLDDYYTKEETLDVIKDAGTPSVCRTLCDWSGSISASAHQDIDLNETLLHFDRLRITFALGASSADKIYSQTWDVSAEDFMNSKNRPIFTMNWANGGSSNAIAYLKYVSNTKASIYVYNYQLYFEEVKIEGITASSETIDTDARYAMKETCSITAGNGIYTWIDGNSTISNSSLADFKIGKSHHYMLTFNLVRNTNTNANVSLKIANMSKNAFAGTPVSSVIDLGNGTFYASGGVSHGVTVMQNNGDSEYNIYLTASATISSGVAMRITCHMYTRED